MKSVIAPAQAALVNFLIHVLSMLVPIEEHLGAALKKAAANKIVLDAEAALAAAETRASSIMSLAFAEADSIQARAKAEHQARKEAAKAVQATPAAITTQGVQALVTAQVVAQGA